MAVTLEGAPRLGWILVKALLRFAFMVANNLVAIPSYICYLILLQPLRVLDSKRFWCIEGIMYKWLLGMVASWGWHAGYTECLTALSRCPLGLKVTVKICEAHLNVFRISYLIFCAHLAKNFLFIFDI